MLGMEKKAALISALVNGLQRFSCCSKVSIFPRFITRGLSDDMGVVLEPDPSILV